MAATRLNPAAPGSGWRTARGFLVLAAACLLTLGTLAQTVAPQRPRPAVRKAVDDRLAMHSHSGQFIVQSPQATPPSLARVTPPSTNTILTLYPDPLAVSGERIKTAVLAELGWPDRWQGRIFLTIDPRGRPVARPIPVARRYGDGWQYSLRLPQEIEGTALIRGMVHVLLLEMANRQAGPNIPEIPFWLIEALTGQVLSRVGPDPLAKPNAVSGKYGHAIGQLVSTMSERALAEEDRKLLNLVLSGDLPSFEELSLPAVERLGGAELDRYRACCQVFFACLRRLPQGDQLLAAFLGQLPQHLNWQTAFLSAYAPVFPRLLDVEKWWALTARRVNAARGRVVLPGVTGAAWLADLASVEVDVRNAPGAPLRREQATLQHVITEWTFPQQVAVLNAREVQFRRLAPNLPGELRVVAEGYANALADYLVTRTRLGYRPGLPGQAAAELNGVVRTTLARLDALDARRKALSPTLSANGSVAATAGTGGAEVAPTAPAR